MNVLARLRRLWQDLTLNQRILIGSVGAGFVVLLVLVAVWAAAPEYTVLYANLEPADASSIVDRLRGDQIPYQVADGGRTIKVPQNRVHELRLTMAADGLPSSGTGYELLDTNKLGWTDFVQKFQHQRALEGEIARTIQTIDEVQSARVHLVMPEPSLFVSQEKPATASVVLHMRSGAKLAPGQIAGVVHLVSSAVEGLDPEHVTLLDTNGTLLSSPQENSLVGVTSDQLSIVQNMEKELTNKVQSLLETVLGPNKAVVRIAAEMDFEHAESTIESFDADNPVVRSEDRSTNTNADGSQTETATTNYEISKKVERKTAPAGKVKRLTASVFVDGTYTDAADGTRTYVPRAPEELTKFQNIIKTAIGFDANRGDALTVENVAFDNAAQDRERAEMEKSERMRMLMEVGGRVGSLLVVAAALFFLVRWVRRSTLFQPSEAEPAEIGPGEVAALLPPVEMDPLQEKIVELARTRPEDVSRLLRIWLREEEK
ncbi:MAG: flagellar M-ring protein FliF [Candidatus Eisenbacteria bacterium]|uniref:Flagellar M-ring protein n=1 Tax=Eiseniibacteriota bacterium TaxID=2212470 RepID=A0A956RPZ6_UNCEI|nr:flagellar M-ring protein FliF [Candidatus Eisenbacteria bacterium]